MTLVLVGVTQIDTMVTANCECGLIRELMVEFIGGRHDVWSDTQGAGRLLKVAADLRE